jgi:hypothetical protein
MIVTARSVIAPRYILRYGNSRLKEGMLRSPRNVLPIDSIGREFARLRGPIDNRQATSS